MGDYVTWLRALAAKGGKGVVNNIDARSLGRIADQLEAFQACRSKIDCLASATAWRASNVREDGILGDEQAGWEVEGFIDRLTRRNDTNSERLVLEAISHLRNFSRDCAALRAEIERLRAALDNQRDC